MSKDEKRRGGFGKFLAGATIGAGLALLFAPQEGKKTRQQLKNKFDELSEKVKNIDVEEVKKNIEQKIDEIRADLQDLDAETVLAIAKDKAKMIARKTEELVAIAIEKGTPVLQKAVDDVRIKTIEVLEITIQKLEAKDTKAKPKTKKANK